MVGRRVMLVEESPQKMSSMNACFKEMGFTVVAELSNASDALARYGDLKPDLVAMNLSMPGGGIATLKGLIEADPRAKVIVISGLHQKSMLMDALDAGAKDFLIEPFDKGELAEVAERCSN